MPKNGNHLLIYTGGIPTDPEVNKLFDEIGIPKPGDRIPYSKIEEITGCQRKTYRWGSVISAWRKRLRTNHHVYLKAIPNEGFEVMTPSTQLMFGEDGIKGAVKQMQKSADAIAVIPRQNLSEEEARRADHALAVVSSTKMHYLTMAKQPKYPELDRAVAENGAS